MKKKKSRPYGYRVDSETHEQAKKIAEGMGTTVCRLHSNFEKDFVQKNKNESQKYFVPL